MTYVIAPRLPRREVGLWVTNDHTMRAHNAQYRGVRKSTDILAFPFHEALAPGRLPAAAALAPEERCLGDLLVSAPYVARWCARHTSRQPPVQGAAVDFEARMNLLLAHGLCHLMGHVHETDAEHAAMVADEDRLLAALATATATGAGVAADLETSSA